MSQFTAAIIAQTCAAVVGKRLGFETLRETALRHGPEGFAEFVELCRQWFTAQFSHMVNESATFSAMQTKKVPGASTFYTYASTIGKALREGRIDEICSMTVSSVTKKNGTKRQAKPAIPQAAETAPAGFTIDDAIVAVLMAHQSGALTPEQYAQLAEIKAPTALPTPMATIVELPALQMAA